MLKNKYFLVSQSPKPLILLGYLSNKATQSINFSSADMAQNLVRTERTSLRDIHRQTSAEDSDLSRVIDALTAECRNAATCCCWVWALAFLVN
jgi:hypothetical protein